MNHALIFSPGRRASASFFPRALLDDRAGVQSAHRKTAVHTVKSPSDISSSHAVDPSFNRSLYRSLDCSVARPSPRDEIARVSGIEVHERGGVIVDDLLRTNDEDIYAIGEVALHG